MNATEQRPGLGRIPSPPDGRDWRLEHFVGLGYPDLATAAAPDPATLAAEASAEFKLTTIRYKDWAARSYPDVTVTHWWRGFNYLSQIVAPPAPPSGDVSWPDPDEILDQGAFGTCVGNGDAQWGNTSPVEDHWDEAVARQLYYEATILDGSPDDPDAPNGGQQGATVRSGVKALKNRGRLSSYAVTYSVDTIKSWLDAKGPVIMGTNWLADMDNPDGRGYVTATGKVEGGHCYVATDHFASAGAIGFLNSWGDWGPLHGRFRMLYADVAMLLTQQGEAWAAVELPIV